MPLFSGHKRICFARQHYSVTCRGWYVPMPTRRCLDNVRWSPNAKSSYGGTLFCLLGLFWSWWLIQLVGGIPPCLELANNETFCCKDIPTVCLCSVLELVLLNVQLVTFFQRKLFLLLTSKATLWTGLVWTTKLSLK